MQWIAASKPYRRKYKLPYVHKSTYSIFKTLQILI